MASLMRKFRKNQKMALAVLTLLSMFAFVFIPTMMQLMGTRGARGNLVVATTTKCGSLTQQQVDSLVYRRRRLFGFLRNLREMVLSKGGRGEAVGMAFNFSGGAPDSEEAAVEDWLLIHKAEELGLKVNQEAINDYLITLTEGKLSNEEVRQLLSRLNMSQTQLFDFLRQEMMSIQLRRMFGESVSPLAATPAQRWEYYQQLNRRAQIEAAPLPVSKFVDKVARPPEADLRAFFEKHKQRLPDPNSPEPGFREPHRVNIQYLKAAVESFMDPAAVSEQAIRDYYEANKESLYQDMLPEAPLPATRKAAAPKAEPGKAAGAGKAAPKPGTPTSAPAKPEAAKPAPGAAPAKTASPKAGPPKLEPSKTAPPKTEPPKAQPPKTGAEKGKTAAPQPAKKTSLVRQSPFRLVAEQKTATPPPAPKTEPPAPKPSSSTPKAASPKAAPSAMPAPKGGSPKAAPSATPASKAAPAAKGNQPPAKGPPAYNLHGMAGVTAPAGASAPTPPPVKYRPLSEVKDEIRKALARQAAREKIQDVVRRIQDRLTQFATKWANYEAAEPEKKASMSPPKPSDFVALAKENHLTAGETGLMSDFQMAGADIGKSRVEGATPFVSVAFAKNTPKYLPGTSQDSEGDTYVYWKVDDKPERVPAFDDPGVRQRVLDTWKLIQARDIAIKEADRLAAEARSAKKPLAQVFAGRKDLHVLTPPPFTWLTYGNLPVYYRFSAPRYSEVPGIPNASTEFMKGVFDLKAGQVGVTADQPKTTIYVVHVIDYTPSDSVLWDMFITDDYRTYVMASQYDQRVAVQLWRERIQTEAGLHWEKEPSRGRGGDVED